jgi:hypothetical protein
MSEAAPTSKKQTLILQLGCGRNAARARPMLFKPRAIDAGAAALITRTQPFERAKTVEIVAL